MFSPFFARVMNGYVNVKTRDTGSLMNPNMWNDLLKCCIAALYTFIVNEQSNLFSTTVALVPLLRVI